MGDFNFQIQEAGNFYAKKLLSLLDSMGFVQLVPITPTHIRGGTLDLILCPKERIDTVKSVDVFPDGTSSDHFLVLAELLIDTGLGDSRTRRHMEKFRDFKKVDPDMFQQALRTLDWTELYGMDSPEEALDVFVEKLDDLIDRTVPLRKRKKGEKRDKPWRDDPEVRAVLRERRKAERAWEANRTAITKKRFNELKRQFGRVDKEARMKRVKEDLEDSRYDPKALQRKLNRLLGKSENILPDTWNTKKLPEDFADYFSGKVEKICSSISEERNHSRQRQDKTRQGKTRSAEV